MSKKLISSRQLAEQYLATISGPDVELKSGRILSHLIESAFLAGWAAHENEVVEVAKKLEGIEEIYSYKFGDTGLRGVIETLKGLK